MRSIVQKFIPIFFSFFFFSISANASEIWWWDAEYSFVCSDIVEKHPNGKGYVSGYASSYEEGINILEAQSALCEQILPDGYNWKPCVDDEYFHILVQNSDRTKVVTAREYRGLLWEIDALIDGGKCANNQVSISGRVIGRLNYVGDCSANQVPNENGECSDPPTCLCNENLINNECVPMDVNTSIEWSSNIAYLYKYPANNQGLRCDPVPYHERNSCSGSPSSSSKTQVGNPIDCATGQKVQIDTDYQGSGTDPLSYTRVYHSPKPATDEDSVTPDTTDPLLSGGNWINVRLPAFSLQTFEDDSQVGVFSIGHWVRRVFYRKTATSGWSSNPNLWPISLSDNSDGGRVVVLRGKTYPLNSSGQAEATQQHHIQRYFYTYNSRGLVSRIRNRFGAYLQFRYDDNDRLIQLTDQAGISIHYQYDAHGNLTGVIYPDDTPNDLTDNPRKTYVYENPDFPAHLTGIIDEQGVTFASFAYDDNGRGIQTEHAHGTNRVVISYPEDGQAIVRFYRDVDANAYREERYTYGQFRGAYRLTSRTIQVCDDCTLGTEAWTYNDAGLLESHESLGGQVTTYSYDSDGRKLSQTDASGTAQARTTTYTWDTDLEQILTETTDTTVTTYSYDSNGLLQSQTVTPVE